MLGDYNLNYLNKTEKSKLDIFASNSGLEVVYLRDATRCTDKTFTLIDYCFISKDEIIACNVTTTPFNSDHFLVIFESNLSLKSESDKITMRNFLFFSRSKLNRDLALAEWWRIYQCENGNDMFDSFIDFFEKIVEKHAPVQTVKKSGESFKNFKPWLTQELKHLIAQKHLLFNKWKKVLTARPTKILSVLET